MYDHHNFYWFIVTEAFELQSNELYGVSLVTKYQGLKNDHHLQEFKENREVSTKLTEQPQRDEQLIGVEEKWSICCFYNFPHSNSGQCSLWSDLNCVT